MKRILVAVDGSDPALRALELATNLAGKYGAELVVVHVIQPPQAPPGFYGPFDELETGAREHGKEILEQAVEQPHVRALRSDARLRIGDPGSEIVEAARELDADMVVVGSRGRGVVARLLLGSVADRVAHLSSKPVLIVH